MNWSFRERKKYYNNSTFVAMTAVAAAALVNVSYLAVSRNTGMSRRFK